MKMMFSRSLSRGRNRAHRVGLLDDGGDEIVTGVDVHTVTLPLLSPLRHRRRGFQSLTIDGLTILVNEFDIVGEPFRGGLLGEIGTVQG